MKTSLNLVDNLLQLNEFYEAKERFPVHTFLKKVLTKHLFDMVLFAKFQNDTLTIGVHHPSAQFELTGFKPILIQYAKQMAELSSIKDVKIFRYDKLKPKSLSISEKPHEIQFFSERSYGIFENHLKDKELFDKMESIRNTIQKGKKWK